MQNVTLFRLPRSVLVAAALCAVSVLAGAQQQTATHIVPFFPAALDLRPLGLVRIVNLSDEPGTLDIVAIDAAGVRVEGVSLAIGAGETAHFDSDDLESGNPDAGLSGATGAGQGDWRLELTSTLDFEVQAYARTADGALAEMYETAAREGDRFRIATVNPGSNVNQASWLRLANPGDEPAAVTVRGIDDAGASPGAGITLEIPPGEAVSFTAAELESGVAPGLQGSLGDGEGKWRLDLESSVPIQVMSLLSSPTGHLTNMSTVPAEESGGIHRVPLFPPASNIYGRQGFARVVNRSDTAGEVRIEAFDDTTWTYDPLILTVDARETQHFNSQDLELGNADKGLTGSTGAGEGDWRLQMTSDLDIEVLSYVRTVGGQGYVTPMYDTASRESGGLMRYYVPIFHPPEYDGQESRLHLVNLGSADVQVGISGRDDAGQPPAEGDVSLVLAGGATRVLAVEQLEQGDSGLDGRFGTGSGSWRLFVTAGGNLQVMSLGYSTEGFLANLSRGRPPVAKAGVGHPDLAVGRPTVGDSAPEAGVAFALSVTVTNQGEGDAESTRLRFYRSTNTHISTADPEIGSNHVNALSAGESSRQSMTATAPPESGTYFYGACVDAVGGESDVTNNCSPSATVTVIEPSGQPDLVVGTPAVNYSEVPAGEAFTLSASVRNRGEAPAAPTTLRYYRSVDATISTRDTLAGTDAVIALSANGSSGESIALNARADAGVYYYGACVDAVADESDTTNNCSSAVTVTVPDPASRRPDLLVEPPSVSEHRPDGGASFQLSATVRNVGGGAAAATTLTYYRSNDAAISSTDSAVGSDPVAGLEASASSGETIVLTAPADSGAHYYGACVDTVPEETEIANNCSSAVLVTVPEPPRYPDLVVESPSVSKTSPQAGEEFTLSATVRNQGDGEADATTLRYYQSTDANITTSDTSVGSDAVAPLASGGSAGESGTVTAPSAVGTYHYGACVDAVANESDETNNCSTSVQITVVEPRYPDLVVQSARVSNNNPAPGADFTLSATVRNQGDGNADATTLRYYRSSDTDISNSDTQVGTDYVARLAPSATSGESVTLTTPSDAGTYYYGACVDAVTGESDITNNCSLAATLTVSQSEGGFGAMTYGLPSSCSHDFPYGFVLNRDSEQAAIDAAERACIGDGGSREHCELHSQSFSQCGALYTGYFSTYCGATRRTGSTEAEAKTAARERCKFIGYRNCRKLVSGCNR